MTEPKIRPIIVHNLDTGEEKIAPPGHTVRWVGAYLKLEDDGKIYLYDKW